MKPPKRKHEMTLTFSGDELKDIVRGLSQVAFDIESGHVGPCVSGGVSSGWHWQINTNPEMTHEQYVLELDKYLSFLRESQ